MWAWGFLQTDDLLFRQVSALSSSTWRRGGSATKVTSGISYAGSVAGMPARHSRFLHHGPDRQPHVHSVTPHRPARSNSRGPCGTNSRSSDSTAQQGAGARSHATPCHAPEDRSARVHAVLTSWWVIGPGVQPFAANIRKSIRRRFADQRCRGPLATRRSSQMGCGRFLAILYVIACPAFWTRGHPSAKAVVVCFWVGQGPGLFRAAGCIA